MNYIDWLVLLITISFIVIYGGWKTRKSKNLKEFLKGNNRSNWYTIGLSVMATQASAITFLSTPGQAFNDGMGFIQFYFGLPIAMIIICIFFIPIYKKFKIYTAYEYLEQRFDRKTRILTSLLFLIQRGLAAGITIYAPSIILSVMFGWNLKILVIIIGIMVVFYTVIGGTKALNVTQKQQMLIIFTGLIFTFIYLLNSISDNISITKAIKIASLNNKINLLDFSFNLESRYTFWSGITGGLFLALSYFGTDQSQVQRYITGKSVKESQLGLIMNGLLKIPLQFVILLLGVMVFIFYQSQISPIHFNPVAKQEIIKSENDNLFKDLKEKNHLIQKKIINVIKKNDFESSITLQNDYKKLLEQEKNTRILIKEKLKKKYPEIENNDKDYVFINYVIDYLPTGLVGLLLAVIFSAAMSSTASELNALASTTLIDLYKTSKENKSEKHYLKMSKLFVIVWGTIAVIFALTGNLFENLIQLVNIIGSLFYGTILGIFLTGFFLKKINSQSVFYAAIVSEIIVITIYFIDVFGFLWLNVIGTLLTILFAWINKLIIFRKN